jgi:hypothetical protein
VDDEHTIKLLVGQFKLSNAALKLFALGFRGGCVRLGASHDEGESTKGEWWMVVAG